MTQESGSVSMVNEGIEWFLDCFPLPQLQKKFLISLKKDIFFFS